MDQKTKEIIDNEISNNEICLFMKGTPDAPQCGFSMTVSNILKVLEVKNSERKRKPAAPFITSTLLLRKL